MLLWPPRPLAARAHNAGSVQSEIGQKLAAGAVLDVAIGDAETANMAGVEAGVGGSFQDGAAETAHQHPLFHRDDQRTFADCTENRRRIERLDESGVDDAEVDAIGRQPLGRVVADAQERAAGDEHSIRAPVQHLGPRQFDRRCRPFGVRRFIAAFFRCGSVVRRFRAFHGKRR